DGDGARTLQESVARPDQAGVVGDGNDRRAGGGSEPRAADLVRPFLARRDAGAFGEDDHPEALREALLAALRHEAQRRMAAAAVDRDRAHQREAPAEEGYPQQLALEHVHLRRKEELEGERLPRRLVLGEDDRRALREVFTAF